MAGYDVQQVVVQLVAGIGALLATAVTSVVGLVRRRPLWLYLAAACILGPAYYVAGLSDALVAVAVVAPALCTAAGVALQRGKVAVAGVLVIPVAFMLFLFLLMYVLAAGA